MRHQGDSSPCGQSPMDFESISLATRTQCLGNGQLRCMKAIWTSTRPQRASMGFAGFFKRALPAGLEPAIFGLEVRRLVH